MDSKTIFEKLQAQFGEEAVYDFHEPEVPTQDTWFFVKPEAIQQVTKFLRDDNDLACNYMECLTGVDYPDQEAIHVVYHVYSYRHRHRAILKVSLPREAPKVASVSNVWSAALWQERECYDLLGVDFTGHPDLRRLMMPDDWVGHPLRKDYEEPAEYHGISTTRLNPIELLTKPKPVKKAKPAAAKKPADKKDKPKVDKPKQSEKDSKSNNDKSTGTKADKSSESQDESTKQSNKTSESNNENTKQSNKTSESNGNESTETKTDDTKGTTKAERTDASPVDESANEAKSSSNEEEGTEEKKSKQQATQQAAEQATNSQDSSEPTDKANDESSESKATTNDDDKNGSAGD